MRDTQKFIAATRGSLLARTQSGQSVDTLFGATGVRCEIRCFKTEGDRITDRPLTSFGGTGVFVKELERALIEGEADVAIHSLKDVPTDVAEGLVLAAFLPREDARDILITPTGAGLEELPKGAHVGTGSPRRILQLRALRPDLVFSALRGNIDTRLEKLAQGACEAIVLARAGLLRLGKSVQGRVLETDQCLPAPGQGAIVFECRSDDRQMLDLLARINDADTEAAVTAERALMHRLEGGCKIPLAAHGRVREGRLQLEALTGDEGDGRTLRLGIEGAATGAAELGRELADLLREGCVREGIPLPTGA
ncbi:MAG: hydroxymethylbilane synthase [Planctomycetes bacterium]|nr:hydroxymethylbilane synthase [Planctomycetota bacterium]